VGIMGSQICSIVGKSQAALVMIHPVISTRTRMTWRPDRSKEGT
jgi:hypothetical protein